MKRLDDLFSVGALDAALTQGLVVRREHDTAPLAILNYTERCQYERGNWNDVTRQCRGLIYNVDTGEIVARPFRKFFNYGQSEAPPLDVREPATVTDKLDGSLGILYRQEVGYAIATRGAFASDQARHATAVWCERYNDVPVPVGWTLLFEILYPENRIVVDYRGMDDLVLLGAVNVTTGRSIAPDDPLLAGWPGPRASVLPYLTLTDALSAPPRPNAEGVVVHLLHSDERVKIKQEDYVALHRIVTGLNERTVWEHLAASKPLAQLLEPLPDEFHGWVGEVAADLVAKVEADAAEIERAYSTILAALPSGHSRKDFAARAVPHPLKWGLFNRLDGKDYRAGLWKAARPEGTRSPRGIAFSEDTA